MPSDFSSASARSTRRCCAASSFQPSSEVKASGSVGHQRALLGPDFGDDVQEAAVGVAFEVQLETRPPRPHQLGQIKHVAAADVALVGARMRGQPIGPGIMRDPAEMQHIGHPGAPRIAQQRDLVEVDAEPGHRSRYYTDATARSVSPQRGPV